MSVDRTRDWRASSAAEEAEIGRKSDSAGKIRLFVFLDAFCGIFTILALFKVTSYQSDKQNKDNAEQNKHDEKKIILRLQQFIAQADNNKLKENVWKNDAIDLFLKYSGSEADPDYRFAGHCLSAVVDLYVLRINLLYEDVTRFCAIFRSRGEFC